MYLKDLSLISLAFLQLRRMQEGVEKDVLGILVSYKIKINLMVAGGGCVSASLTPVLAQRNVFSIEIKCLFHFFLTYTACWVALQQGEWDSHINISLQLADER